MQYIDMEKGYVIMKTVKILLCLIVLLTIAVPVADALSITSFSPEVGYQGKTTTITIIGDGFNSSVSVLLMKSGEDNETVSNIESHTSTEIVCRLTASKLTSMEDGSWYFVVINPDSQVKATQVFKVRPPMKLTSITPEKARTNNDSVKFTIAGSGLGDVEKVYLHHDEYGNISAMDVEAPSATKVTGEFDLDDKEVDDDYEVCVMDNFDIATCDLDFEITSDAVGSIDVSSSPSGASVYLDGTLKGTTPLEIDDLEVGSYKLLLKKSGYSDWLRNAKVTNGGTTTYDADLDVVKTATPTKTSTPVTTATTIKVTRSATVATPTPWPTSTPTPESPVDPLVIIGGVGLALIVLRKH
ncbi:MAG: PEGA domain-containing protein [Methanoregula sp.]|uniref:PEGA domain-containing protein n=1 Tax=Methanoregula sp. TaxID=2052170 RepID=UPI0025FCEFB4|nr:PEGA domain-containing protein [Methanoregula sp.]MCK9630025.1 PEGA domain-containing protein [Methanoregula sp.]